MSFAAEKKRVLQRKDHSRKGSIDSGIKKLVAALNKLPEYYTTSSCAGRVKIFVPRAQKQESQCLLESHNRVTFIAVKRALQRLPGKDVYFRQESFILHVCCRDLEAAEKLLARGQNAGLKRSGIIAAKRRVIVELVSTEHFDTIIARKGKVLVDDGYLRILVSVANEKMRKNREKIAYFLSSV